MEDDRAVPGRRRLIQLALRDAVQSRLCLNSPIKSQMEKEKRERRKLNKITIWTESSCQNSTLAPNVLIRESSNGFRTNTSDAKWSCSWNKSLPNAGNQSDSSPSSRHEFRDKYRNESYNQCVNNNYNLSVPFNASKFGGKELFSTASSETSNMLTFTASDCNWRDVKANAAFPGLERNNVHTSSRLTLLNSQPICSSYNCTDENIPAKHIKAGVSLNSCYDLPILSQSCESGHSNGMPGTSCEDMSEIPKMSSDLLKHLAPHSLENSLKHSKEEPLSDFIGPPVSRSRLLKDDEQNNLSSSVEILASSQVEIPAPVDTTDQLNSPKFDCIVPAEEQCVGCNENSYSDKRPANSSINYLKNSSTIPKHSMECNPHFSTFKHFEGLICDNEKRQSSFITVITDNLELKIVSHPSQLDSYDAECPISKPKGVNADLLVDSFLNLDDKMKRDDTISSNFMSCRKAFDDMFYSTNTGDIIHPEVERNSSHEKNILETSNGGFHSSSLSRHFPKYGAPFSNINPEVSMSNPYANDNLTNYDEVVYAGNFASKEGSPTSYSVTSPPRFETVHGNCSSTSESKFLNSFNGDYNLFNPDDSKDPMSSSKSNNLPLNHFCNSSKLGKSVDVLNTFSLDDNSRQCSDSLEDSVSHYGDDALKSRSLNKASGSLDSGIGLVSDEHECDSVWNLL